MAQYRGMSKSIAARQGGRIVASYSSTEAMAADLGVQVYYDTFSTGTLQRGGVVVGTWSAYRSQQYI